MQGDTFSWWYANRIRQTNRADLAGATCTAGRQQVRGRQRNKNWLKSGKLGKLNWQYLKRKMYLYSCVLIQESAFLYVCILRINTSEWKSSPLRLIWELWPLMHLLQPSVSAHRLCILSIDGGSTQLLGIQRQRFKKENQRFKRREREEAQVSL